MNKKHQFIPLLLLFLLTGGELLAQVYQQGLDLLDREQPQKALTYFASLTAKEPQKTEGYFYLGIAHLKEKNLEAAGQAFQQAVSLEPKSALAQAGLGYWHQQSGRQPEAKAAFEKALQLSKSKDEEVIYWLAEAGLRETNPALVQVHELLGKGLKLSDRADLHILKGDAYLMKGEGGPAVSSYEKALALNQQNAKALTRLGRLYTITKNLPLALQYLQQATAADPAYAPAFKDLGEAYYQMKKPVEAATNYEKYLSLTENKHQARMRCGYFMYLAKDWNKANQLFSEVLSQEPANAIILKYQAYSLLEAGQLQQAEAAFAQYFELVPEAERDVLDHEKWARLLIKQQKDTAAIEQYKLLLAKAPEHTEGLQTLGDLYFKQKAFTLASAVYEKLIGLRKQPMAQDYFVLGRAYYFSSDYQQADTAFTKLMELQPSLLAAALWKARTQASLDSDSEKGLAKPFYEQVVEKGNVDASKYKNELKEAYSYLGYYYYMKSEMSTSKDYWVKVKAIDPQDDKANNALKALNP